MVLLDPLVLLKLVQLALHHGKLLQPALQGLASFDNSCPTVLGGQECPLVDASEGRLCRVDISLVVVLSRCDLGPDFLGDPQVDVHRLVGDHRQHDIRAPALSHISVRLLVAVALLLLEPPESACLRELVPLYYFPCKELLFLISMDFREIQ